MRFGLMIAAAVALAACELKQAEPEADQQQDAAAAPQVTGPEPAPQVPPPVPQGPALAESNSQNGDFRMAVTEASRSNGVLTVKARVTLLDGETGSRRLLYSTDADKLYLVSGDQKYMMLKDNEGVPLTTSDGFYPNFRRLGDSNMWWGKFPAPPPEVRNVSLYFKDFEPAENIPITDR